ncbi:hypothetical protein QOZ88_05960 [Blastococcus sp. BMG 814]|uniref:Head-to-tail stopper n=1 Tax=Blastococcus carthaginiensis TaxID=3050034 RepID=A0ABT9I9C0_9ACTN|nr:hypothetical protein [Blastococcus carthaginiensis]MDP5182175.1 hypothetical protein [Blastococcus carthaginiensis]
MFHQQVTRLRGVSVTDRYENTTLDWSNPARLIVNGVSVQPRARTETTTDGRTVLVSGWWLCTAPGVDVDLTAADRVEHDGLVLEVDGDVARWPDPDGDGVHHVEAALRRVTG